MAEMAPWAANAWYVACTPDEIDAKPLGRQICGERMVFFRPRAGAVAALEDFCPHRGAPLSLGFVEDGDLVCGYHGLAVDCAGRAARMPSQRVSGFPPTRAFPVVERYGFIWVWPGDPALADPAGLPDLPWAESPDWVYAGGLYNIACDYRLMIDNLMDLTHETYVHATSVGQKEIDEAPVETRVEGDEVVTSRLMPNIPAPPLWRQGLIDAGLPGDAPVDRWQVCRFSPPSHVMIDVGVALAGRGGPEADLGDKVFSIVVDFITPETPASHWYFWGAASRNVGRPDLVAARREAQGKVFAEDRAMLERQQRNLDAHPGRRLLKLNIDAGGVHSRRIIDRLIAAEASATSASSAA
ncbi:MAG: aromatic ring-hydroxylating dioxygenase subunit alpha [Phenylobacterium sp.]|uniref:aromatic ring-hydroxylating oxygenase subunit alpha n=1 Tax=Phenylobacterium sp. TaxID=1871053 RepID=UPI0012033931|nr:aromatic ring-hydroxylating dioxygenase subunit alpha [Phenylobacterium sp.]TAJ69814.1 MAG: aromatic ring-hydroxylating dioxygenase subunit alpha [Phenylobacterium sp.]